MQEKDGRLTAYLSRFAENVKVLKAVDDGRNKVWQNRQKVHQVHWFDKELDFPRGTRKPTCKICVCVITYSWIGRA